MLHRTFAALKRARARLIAHIERRMIDNAGPVLKRAWSVRLIYGAIALDILSLTFSLFEEAFAPRTFSVLSLLIMLGAIYFRLMPQPDLKETK